MNLNLRIKNPKQIAKLITLAENQTNNFDLCTLDSVEFYGRFKTPLNHER